MQESALTAEPAQVFALQALFPRAEKKQNFKETPPDSGGVFSFYVFPSEGAGSLLSTFV